MVLKECPDLVTTKLYKNAKKYKLDISYHLITSFRALYQFLDQDV